ncbi:hypothetical protein NQZ68_033595 [Dissostichus eleginoides]|nr:hypothetical protein NQZ68_033595 [Dissostichus eleginoides]
MVDHWHCKDSLNGKGVSPEVERRSEAGDPEFARASRLEQVCGEARRNTDEVSRGSRADESEQPGAGVRGCTEEHRRGVGDWTWQAEEEADGF